MTPEKATALRRPFPQESVGKLPKPYKSDSARGDCRECGGYHGLPALHLDYVGHAATTDRLLTVDPEWSWEPMAVDQFGSPFCDKDGNLWIKLTVCGVTRIGVGDGKNMKERVGDAIRNAAMRFGVALDLWAKENLVEFAQAASAHQPAGEPDQALVDRVDELQHPPKAPMVVPREPDYVERAEPKPMTARTRGQMFALFGDLDIADDAQLAGINHILGTDYPSRGRLSEDEAKRVITVLQQKKRVSA